MIQIEIEGRQIIRMINFKYLNPYINPNWWYKCYSWNCTKRKRNRNVLSIHVATYRFCVRPFTIPTYLSWITVYVEKTPHSHSGSRKNAASRVSSAINLGQTQGYIHFTLLCRLGVVADWLKRVTWQFLPSQ